MASARIISAKADRFLFYLPITAQNVFIPGTNATNTKMSDIIIYHNGECSKCKGALEILQEAHIPHEVRWYLAEPLTEAELKTLLEKLHMPPSQLVRKSEPLYKENYEGKDISENEWLTILAENPILIERPIVEQGDKAIIARPPEKVFELINRLRQSSPQQRFP
jgi:arsenate reductase (glutaredoxin)